MQILDSLHHLDPHHQYCLEGEPLIPFHKYILQTFTQQVHQHQVVSIFDASSVDPGNPHNIPIVMEILIEFGFEEELGVAGCDRLGLHRKIFVFISDVLGFIDFTEGSYPNLLQQLVVLKHDGTFLSPCVPSSFLFFELDDDCILTKSIIINSSLYFYLKSFVCPSSAVLYKIPNFYLMKKPTFFPMLHNHGIVLDVMIWTAGR